MNDPSPSVLARGMRIVATYARLHPVPFAISIVGAAVFSGLTVLSTVVLGRITDDVVLPAFDGADVPVAMAALAIAAVTILRSVGVVTRRFFAGMMAARVEQTLRNELAGHYLAAPVSWHQERSAGELLAHADNDTEVSTQVIHPLPFSVGVGFLALFSLISLLLVDWIIAAVGLVVFPVMLALNKRYSGAIEGPAAKVQQGVGRVSGVANESFDGALVVKTLGRADAESERFRREVDGLRRQRIRVGFLRATFEPVLDALPNLGIVAVVGVGLWRVEVGAMEPGQLVQVASLFSILALPMRVLGYFLETIPPATVAYERVRAVLDSELGTPPAAGEGRLPEVPLAVELRDVTYRYPGDDRVVLNGVSFRVEPGEVVAVVGSTGAGKSTLVHLLAGLVPADDGSVCLGDVPLVDLAEDERSAAVSIAFQESFLFADSIRANIDLTGAVSDHQVDKAMELAQVERFLDDLPEGLDTVVGERGVTLSGGQRQRVALARAVLRRPRLLILDDATSAVDAKVEQAILDGLRHETSVTTVVVAQRLSTIKLASRVIYLEDGAVAAIGHHDELMSHPGYAALAAAYEEQAV